MGIVKWSAQRKWDMQKGHEREQCKMWSKRLLAVALSLVATGCTGEILRSTRIEGKPSDARDIGSDSVAVYMAGPLGFSETGRHFYYNSLVQLIMKLGCQVLDPWKLTDQSKIDKVIAMPYGPEKRNAWRVLNAEIGQNNRMAIDRARAVLSVLDGADVDSGTAAEIGYAFAKGRIILGYRGDSRLSGDNEGSIVNLQVEYFIRASGGTIVTSFAEIEPTFKRLIDCRQKGN
jgi:nucleoside 2-deoxyribosyltransferase